MTRTEHFRFLSADGSTQLHGVIWAPEEPPVAVLQVAHGVAEYIDRYEPFARYLNDRGILVAGHDHIGHGKSLGEGSVSAYLGAEHGWDHALEDIRTLRNRLQEDYPDVPHFLMGHSMGSFLVRCYLARYPGGLRGAILMGTGWQPEGMLQGGRALAHLTVKLRGAAYVSPLLNQLAFGGYNKPFAPNRTSYDWIAADPAAVDRYLEDPLCGMDVTSGLFRDMLDGIFWGRHSAAVARVEKGLPLLVLSGGDDPVGDMGKGVERTTQCYRQAGHEVRQILYPGLRHEILQETAHRDTVCEDIYQWMAQIPQLLQA
ncbi:MAG: alpha/beta hydrolase [Ruminococcaceae bacterium]|nr:alpha/beta hydrolase [Oscillospiraceae bacterium]